MSLFRSALVMSVALGALVAAPAAQAGGPNIAVCYALSTEFNKCVNRYQQQQRGGWGGDGGQGYGGQGYGGGYGRGGYGRGGYGGGGYGGGQWDGDGDGWRPRPRPQRGRCSHHGPHRVARRMR
jgi:uncharacterized membrane protein